MKNEFQYRLQKSIAAKGITASELSRISGVGKSDISNYINGAYVAKQDKCFQLAKALDVDPGWLMTGDEPASERQAQMEPIRDAEVLELLLAWDKAEDWQKSAVKKLLNMKGE